MRAAAVSHIARLVTQEQRLLRRDASTVRTTEPAADPCPAGGVRGRLPSGYRRARPRGPRSLSASTKPSAVQRHPGCPCLTASGLIRTVTGRLAPTHIDAGWLTTTRDGGAPSGQIALGLCSREQHGPHRPRRTAWLRPQLSPWPQAATLNVRYAREGPAGEVLRKCSAARQTYPITICSSWWPAGCANPRGQRSLTRSLCLEPHSAVSGRFTGADAARGDRGRAAAPAGGTRGTRRGRSPAGGPPPCGS